MRYRASKRTGSRVEADRHPRVATTRAVVRCESRFGRKLIVPQWRVGRRGSGCPLEKDKPLRRRPFGRAGLRRRCPQAVSGNPLERVQPCESGLRSRQAGGPILLIRASDAERSAGSPSVLRNRTTSVPFVPFAMATTRLPRTNGLTRSKSNLRSITVSNREPTEWD